MKAPAVEAAKAFVASLERARLWQGFMSARLLLGFVLVTLQTALYVTGTTRGKLEILICSVYLIGTLVSKIVINPRPLGQSFNRVWGALVGIDLLTFSALQLLQGGTSGAATINYTALFALPLLVASILGTLRLAFGTAAGITVLMLTVSIWSFLKQPIDATPYFVQPALSGVGFFAIAWLANLLAVRLASEGLRAQTSQVAAAILRQVNDLVIESLPDGIVIVDDVGTVHAANPAARQLLSLEVVELREGVFNLHSEPAWESLLALTSRCFESGQSQSAAIVIRHGQGGPLRVHARTRLAAVPQSENAARLCVLFLQDQRELEARIRTEKLAGMGRLSTAVAHEIRNPLAAISQANALLEEDISDPHLKHLTGMVGQNAKRLEKIVNDILNVARIQPGDSTHLSPTIPLDDMVLRLCNEWATQANGQLRLKIKTSGEPQLRVRFDTDHLRRVLVNLLDNALRYTSNAPEAIQVLLYKADKQHAMIAVWSQSPPLDQSVERHLFEPFFSSDSRSSGLGLYLCRELCERHDGSLYYQRNMRAARGEAIEGNEFVITLRCEMV